MRKPLQFAAIVLVSSCLIDSLHAQPDGDAAAAPESAAAPDDATHDELRALRDRVVSAVNAGDIDKLLTELHPNVVVVWQNAEVSRGHDGVRDYYDRMMKGDARLVEKFSVTPSVTELTVLHGGDAGVVYGDATSEFVLTRGGTLEVFGPWSATLVKQDDKWLIAGFHASAGLFDNPLLIAAKRALYWVGGIAVVVGIAIGAGGMAFFKRRQPPRPRAVGE